MNTQPSAVARATIAFLIDVIEGVDSHHASDSGGVTRFGISDLRDGVADGMVDINLDGKGDVPVAALTREQAEGIYFNEYWQGRRCDLLPPAFGILLFDGAVNHRPGTAERFLQRALHVKDDGVIGEKTLARARQYASQPDRVTEIMSHALMHRARFYHDIVRGNSSQLVFLDGWFRRLFLVQQFILTGGWHEAGR